MPKVVDQVASALTAIRGMRRTVGKIALGGFSQGAELSYGLALMHPEMFVRVCPMSGALTAELLKRPRPEGATPEVHGFHGADDSVIRTAAGQLTIAGFTRLGYVADMKVFPGVGHEFQPASDDVSACLSAGARAAVASP
jgi:predicted esterase